VPIIRRLAAPVAAIILILSPATALAQSAGDQQYADPFGNNEQNQAGGGGSGGGGGTAGSQDQEGTSGSSATPSESRDGGLPSAGLAAGVAAVLGAVLLLVGLALRRRRTADARR